MPTPSSLFDISGKVVIVTGSTRGLGLAIAAQMGLAGAKIVVSSEEQSAVAETERDLRDQGIDAIGIKCDVSDDNELQNLIDGTIAAFGGLDVLVCNAGITGKPGPMADIDWIDYEKVMAINLHSVVKLSGLALPHIAARGGGSVILMSSISGLRGNGAISTYALTKAAVAQLARNLAVQWGPHNVRVNAISPGLIRTELSKALLENEAFRTRRMGMTPLRRPGEASEIAGAALFLASPAGAFVTGQNLVVDGGTTITDGS